MRGTSSREEREQARGRISTAPGRGLVRLLLPVLSLLVLFVEREATGSEEQQAVEQVLRGEILAVRGETGRVREVRLRRADGRYLRVELDGNGALLGVRHSGSFAEVTGMVYLREAHGKLIRWVRVLRFRIVPRPADWVEPELVCHEVEGELEALPEDDLPTDAGVSTE